VIEPAIGWVRDTAKDAGGKVGGRFAEYTVCPLDISTLIECGHVFECDGTVADTPGGFIELCIDDDDHPEQLDAIEALYHDCAPTPRHEGLCSYCCGPDCGRGANAYNGCYCPE
jgi:hypothetical protein